MTNLQLTQDISAPVTKVFDYLMNFESYPEFMHSIERVGRDARHPDRIHWLFSLGSVMHQHTTDMTIDDRCRQISWRSASGADLTGHAEVVERNDTAAALRVELRFDPHGPVTQMADALGAVRHRVTKDLRQFATYVESGGHDTPTGRRVAETATPDDRPRTVSERLTDVLFGRENI